MNRHAAHPNPLPRLASLLVAIATVLCLSSSVFAQQAPRNQPNADEADTHTAAADTAESAEETALLDTNEAQAQNDHPFGHTRPMFGPNGVRSHR